MNETLFHITCYCILIYNRRLDGNALVCDCQIMSFVNYMINSHKDAVSAAVCEQPISMRGKKL
jgi:hypothetical protein